MKYVKNQKRLATAIITTALTLFCFGALIARPDQTQFLSTGIILIPIMANTWLPVFTPEGEKPAEGKALRIINIGLDIACLITILAYTILRNDIYLWLSLGCSILLCFSIAATILATVRAQNK